MIETGPQSPPTRRAFAQSLILLSGVGLTTGADLAAAANADEPKEIKVDLKAYQEAMVTVIRYRFGSKLTDKQIERLAERVARSRSSADSLKRVPVTNGDDPIVAFRADLP